MIFSVKKTFSKLKIIFLKTLHGFANVGILNMKITCIYPNSLSSHDFLRKLASYFAYYIISICWKMNKAKNLELEVLPVESLGRSRWSAFGVCPSSGSPGSSEELCEDLRLAGKYTQPHLEFELLASLHLTLLLGE